MGAEKKAVALFFVSHFRGGLKELLWFADVTLHSIWRESLPGAVRRGPSFALLSSLLGAASRERSAPESPTGWIRAWPRSGVETHSTCIRLFLHAKNTTAAILVIATIART